MRILVTGATGFVGQAVGEALIRRGHEVTALVRRTDSPAALSLGAKPGIALLEGEVTEPGPWQRHLTGHYAVVHLVGIISEAGAATFERIHVRSTANALAAAEAAGIRRFVHMSALGTRTHATSRYHQTKWAAEELVRRSQLDWTIFRPSLIYGHRSGFVRTFERLSRFSPAVPVIGDGQARLQPVSVDAVARCFAGAVDEARAVGATLDVAGTEVLTFEQIVSTLLHALGRRRWLVHVPLPLARVQATLLETVLGRWLKFPPPLNRDQILMLQEDNTGDEKPASDLFGLTRVNFKEDLARTLR